MQRIILFLLLLLLTPQVYADSFGDVAENLFGPVEVLNRLMIAASYVIGILLIVFAAAQYKIHKQNPKVTHLSTVFFLLVAGLVLLALPKATTMVSETWSPTVAKQKELDAKAEDEAVLGLNGTEDGVDDQQQSTDSNDSAQQDPDPMAPKPVIPGADLPEHFRYFDEDDDVD